MGNLKPPYHVPIDKIKYKFHSFLHTTPTTTKSETFKSNFQDIHSTRTETDFPLAFFASILFH